jgi:hypothetical protein
MSVSASDAFSAIRFIFSVVSKARAYLLTVSMPKLIQFQVKDNREELSSLATRLQHILLSLEDSRTRNLIQSQEYTDALTAFYE